jgi:hypothetical protein
MRNNRMQRNSLYNLHKHDKDLIKLHNLKDSLRLQREGQGKNRERSLSRRTLAKFHFWCTALNRMKCSVWSGTVLDLLCSQVRISTSTVTSSRNQSLFWRFQVGQQAHRSIVVWVLASVCCFACSAKKSMKLDEKISFEQTAETLKIVASY